MSARCLNLKLSPTMYSKLAGRHLWFLLFWVLSLVPFWLPLSTLVGLSFRDERYSHVVLIPAISVLLLWLERRRVFLEPRYGLLAGAPFLLLGTTLYSAGKAWSSSLGQNDSLSVMVLGIVLVWIAGFVLCYGMRPFRNAIFPLVFLLLMIP